jgi:hemolysin activation/secretion protein
LFRPFRISLTGKSGRGAASWPVAAFLLALWCGAAVAQVRPDAGSVLESTKPTVPAAPPSSREVLPRPPEPKPALGAPGLKLVVTGFRISGNTIYPEDVLLETVKEFVGKEQNIDGLNDAATKVRAYYRERGYFLAQAYLPQQEIKGGVVEIAVIEARLGKVALDFRQGTRFSESLVRGIVEQHLKEGEFITENGLETPLLLLNDFPNAVVTSEIKPSQTLGAADLTVHISSAPGLISGSVDIDNQGNRFTGAIRTGVSVDLSNPLALGDQLSYRAFVTDERMGFYRLAYALPVGYWGTRVGMSYSSFHYQLGKDFHNLQAHGVGGIATLFAFHPVLRTRSSNLIVQFAYEDKRLNDRVESAAPPTNQYRRIVSSKLGVVGDIRDGILGGGLNSYSYTVTEGNVFIGPETDLIADQGLRRTAGRFAKHNFEFRRLQKISDNISLLLALQGQMASKNLQSAEKFSLGGATGVRAYPSGEALGDTGYIFQGELRYIVPGFKIGNGDLTLSTFYDQGWVRINENKADADTQNNRRLNGYGFGASVGKDSDFIVRGAAALQVENEAPQSDTVKRVPRIWVQAIKWF